MFPRIPVRNVINSSLRKVLSLFIFSAQTGKSVIHEGVGVDGEFFSLSVPHPWRAALAHTSRLCVHGIKIAGRERSRAF